MKVKARWINSIVSESTKPGIDLPWSNKRNSFARVAPVLAARSVRFVRVPASVLRSARG